MTSNQRNAARSLARLFSRLQERENLIRQQENPPRGEVSEAYLSAKDEMGIAGHFLNEGETAAAILRAFEIEA